MVKVKNYMNAYASYAKSEREKLQALKDSNMYSQEYLLDAEKKMNQGLESKRHEYLKEINAIIDGKLAGVKKPDTSSVEYQTAVSNIFTKVQLLGRGLTAKLLNEILAPAIEKQDNSTLESVRSFIEGIADFPGGDIAKRDLLESIPRVVNRSELLENARAEINGAFTNRNFGMDGMSSSIAVFYLEQSGVFEL